MRERLRILAASFRTIWALIAAMLLLFSVVIALTSLAFALRSTHNQLDDLRVESSCRSESAIELDIAISLREDALADLDETIARLFDASIKRDTAAIATEGEKLPGLSDRIRAATEAVHAARVDRVDSVERCDEKD